MTGTPERKDGERLEKKGVPPLTTVLDALLSVTFLVLAAYIGYYASSMSGKDERDLFRFSMLLGAYGVWRAIRSVIRHRRRDEDDGE